MHIELANGGFAQIDDADWPLVSPYVWRHYTNPAQRSLVTYAVVCAKVNGKWTFLQMHRLILSLSDPHVRVDHRNRDGLDNQRRNLRIATQAQNAANSPKRITNTSGFKGVFIAPRKATITWFAQIGVNGKAIFLGRFTSPVDAAKAYDAAAVRYFGEYAYLNFPPTPA